MITWGSISNRARGSIAPIIGRLGGPESGTHMFGIKALTQFRMRPCKGYRPQAAAIPERAGNPAENELEA